MNISRFLPAALLIAAFCTSLKAQEPDVVVQHYTIKAEIIPAEHRLISEAQMLIKNLGPVPAQKLQFRLTCDKVQWLRDVRGREVPYRTHDGMVEMDVELMPLDSLVLTIAHEGTFLGTVSDRIEEENSWLLSESEWYPQVTGHRQYSNWFTYDLYITVPSDQTGISGGKLLSETEKGARKTFHWAMHNLPTQRISVISATYEKQEFTGGQHPVTTYFFARKTPDASRQQGVRDSPEQIAALVDSVITFYSKEFGEYPFDDFKIVETNRRGGYGDRGLILLNRSDLRSSFEDFRSFLAVFVLSHELAHQWWGNEVGHDHTVEGEAFFQESLTQYSAWRYWEQQGITKSRKLSSQIGPFSIIGPIELTPLEWEFTAYKRLYDYRPISAIRPGERDFSRAAHFKGVYFLKALKSTVGPELMREGLCEYVRRFKFKTASLQDFKRTIEKVSGKNLDEPFRDWLQTTKRADYAISDLECVRLEEGKYSTKIRISNVGDLSVPVEVVARTESGKEIPVHFDDKGRSEESQDIRTDEEVVSAVLDPNWDLLDVNRTNNFLPRKVEYHFLFSSPSLTARQRFFGPSFTYGLTDGARLGAWITNKYPLESLRRIPYFFEWRAAAYYGIKSKRPGYSLSADSWYGMSSNRWNYGGLFEEVRGAQVRRVQGSYRWADDHKLAVTLESNRLYDISYYDARDFEQCKTTAVATGYINTILGRSIAIDLKKGIRALGSPYDFTRLSLTISGWYPVIPRTSFRLFAGAVRGSYPSQEALFLGGSVWPTSAAYWFVDPDRKVSTQEALHTSGDANLRGYASTHARGRNAVSLNSEFVLPTYSFVRIFADVGNVWGPTKFKLLWDAGIGLDFQFLRFDFPLFVSSPLAGEKQLRFRWLLEVKF